MILIHPVRTLLLWLSSSLQVASLPFVSSQLTLLVTLTVSRSFLHLVPDCAKLYVCATNQVQKLIYSSALADYYQPSCRPKPSTLLRLQACL